MDTTVYLDEEYKAGNPDKVLKAAHTVAKHHKYCRTCTDQHICPDMVAKLEELVIADFWG